jgi:VWFA-related protein
VYHRRVHFPREVPVLQPLRSLLIFGCLATQHSTLLDSQTVEPNANGPVVFHANAQTVILDVVVTAQNGRPVEGLHKGDFVLAEDGYPQSITSFEEHTGAQSVQAAAPELPPNIFTNVPRVKPTDSVTILLLDTLNTPPKDQLMVRAQLGKYLKGLKPGKPMALFALETRFRLIHGFTTDPAVLAEALSHEKGGAPLLQSDAEFKDNVQMLNAPGEQKEPGSSVANREFLQPLLTREGSSETDLRVKATLEALQELARSVAGMPGRKNVVWVSTAFPLTISPDPDLSARVSSSFSTVRGYEDEVRRTDALLAASRVAIYPIAAEGVTTNILQDVELNIPLIASDRSTMDLIAKDTGGIAFYDNNGFNGVLDRIIDHGSHFYTLSYVPTNTATDGKYRNTEVKVSTEGYKLAYRRGYYAAGGKSAQDGTAGHPSHGFMRPGMPDATQIHFALRVHPEASLSGKNPPPQVSNQVEGSTNAGGKNRLKGPHTRYTVEFGVAQQDLQLNMDSDGTRRGRIESMLVVYDHDGKALNWIVKHVDLHIDAAHYKSVQVNGIHFPLEIDIPKSGFYLQAGVYDELSNQDGTLELPLSRIVAGQGVSSN